MSTEQANESALAVGNTFVWHELYAKNVDEAVTFYTEALGFGVEEMEMGEMGVYKMLSRNGRAICGVCSSNVPGHGEVPPHWATYLSVDDVDARLGKAVEHGAIQLVAPMDVPTVGRMALIQDPSGAQIWLFKGE